MARHASGGTGDVIPYVVQVVTSRRPRTSRPFAFPRRCPACGALAVRAAGEGYWRCVASGCPARLKERLRHVASRRAMDIEHLKAATIGALVDRKMARDFADLYRLSASDLMRIEGFAPKSADNLVRAIDASRTRGLSRLLNALGIRLVGVHVAQLLATRYGRLDRLAAAPVEELAATAGVGPAIAESVAKFFADPANRAVLERLAAAGVSMAEPAERR